MKTTTITVNAECPGCGTECPPKLGIPNAHQHGWVWDARTGQRWCRRCHADLEAGRHFKAFGWVWKVTRHEPEGDHVRYVDELTNFIKANEAYGRVTVAVVYDPERLYMPPTDPRELLDRMEQMTGELAANGPDIPDRYLMIHTANSEALREEMKP